VFEYTVRDVAMGRTAITVTVKQSKKSGLLDPECEGSVFLANMITVYLQQRHITEDANVLHRFSADKMTLFRTNRQTCQSPRGPFHNWFLVKKLWQ
jgi:hypothetical protein